jgi:hypothetical protein
MRSDVDGLPRRAPPVAPSHLRLLPWSVKASALCRDPPAEPIQIAGDDFAPELTVLGRVASALQRHGDVTDLRLRVAVSSPRFEIQHLLMPLPPLHAASIFAKRPAT